MLIVMIPSCEGPFSSLTPSMWPLDIMKELKSEDSNNVMKYDELGFKINDDILSKNNLPNKNDDNEFLLKWKSYMKALNSHSDLVTMKAEELYSLIRSGIPHSYRPQLWLQLSGGLQKNLASDISYSDIVKASSTDNLEISTQIEKDLLRTLPNNVCFSNMQSTGIPRLRRLLRGLAWFFPEIGYCQGMSIIVAHFLLVMEEENAFWLMTALIEDILPFSFYAPLLLGLHADQKALQALLPICLPKLNNFLNDHNIELPLVTTQWFLTLFSNVFKSCILLRIWDLLFYEGTYILFIVALGILQLQGMLTCISIRLIIRFSENEILKLINSSDIFTTLASIPNSINNVDDLLDATDEIRKKIDKEYLKDLRKQCLDEQLTIHSSLLQNHNFNKQNNMRRIDYNASNIEQLNNPKFKNIHQTELLMDLWDSILTVAQHFQNSDIQFTNISLIPDYSLQSHNHDHDTFVHVAASRRKRARALLDFERHDGDELGFKKNDIITVILARDEHCWVGELNGLRGWFPARFVTLLDERTKEYTPCGDDSVTPIIADLVRGPLCSALKRILEYGMKKCYLLGGPCHPWLFIEEVANHEINKDFNSVYSRLVLCRTFRLDEDGKVLSPEELLFRCVQAINISHDAYHAQMDVKLRSLICLGLNEQVLHLWLEAFCVCTPVIDKWYYASSFLHSPAWVQIKCELRILSHFPFTLNADYELPSPAVDFLQESIKDMLVKHHLFSWDL